MKKLTAEQVKYQRLGFIKAIVISAVCVVWQCVVQFM